jgi:hypothetical protein
MVSLVALKGAIKNVSGALEKGLARHGDKFTVLDSFDTPHEADAYIQTNLLKPKINNGWQGPMYRFIRDSGKPYLVNESPSFRRHLGWTRLGWWSYKWTEGEFGNENSPSDRWNKFKKESGVELKDWNSPGDAILIMGQKEGDSSLLNLYKDYKSFYDWVEHIILKIQKHTDRPIILRPHPRNLSRGRNLSYKLQKKYPKLKISVSENTDSLADYLPNDKNENKADGLYDDLKKAHCVITYNSLSAIEAICEGIPTFAFENGSMIWPIRQKDFATIENLNYNIDRTQWSYDIAYTQWTQREHATGESWAHLKPLIFGDNNA